MAANQLPPGTALTDVQQAVDASGYPLQSIVANRLKDDYAVIGEWGFRDRTTQEMRALDLLARRDLYEPADANACRVRPGLILLIECKRSALPYVFFEEGSGSLRVGGFPKIGGLRDDAVVVETDDDRSSWHLTVLQALSLELHDFLTQPPTSATFSKCVRKGSDLTLSGTDAYQGSVLPLMSATEHFLNTAAPRPTFHYFDAFVVVPVAVLDAPMVAVTVDEHGSSHLRMTEWQRIWRVEPPEGPDPIRHGTPTALDVVHMDFLQEYLDDHLLPFAALFAERAVEHAEELASGRAFAPGMGADSRTALHTRLMPRTVDAWPAEEQAASSLPLTVLHIARAQGRAAADTFRLRREQRLRRGL